MKWGLLVAVIAVLLLNGCALGSRRTVTEERRVSGFDRVVLEGIGDLTIHQGAEEALTIEAESNVISRITTEVRGGTLYIGYRTTVFGQGVIPTRGIAYELTARELEGIELVGAGVIRMEGLETDRLDMRVGGAGKIVVRSLAADRLRVEHTGAGKAELAGRVQRQDVDLTGAGDYDGADLRSDEATVRVSGVGRATVWVLESLDAEISGAGAVHYYGEPRLRQNISGVGQIKALGER